MAAEIIGRVIAGIGGNGMYIGTLTLLVAHTTAVERGGYLASMYVRLCFSCALLTHCSGVVWGLGTVLGPVSIQLNDLSSSRSD